MKKFSFKLLPIILAYCTLCNEISCSGRPNQSGFHKRGSHKRGSPNHGPRNRGPHNRGPPHRGPPQRVFNSHPPPNRHHQDDQNQTIIDTTFVYDSGTIKAGDHLECKITNVTSVDVKNRSCDTHILIQPASSSNDFVFVPLLKDANCFSFQIRTDGYVYLLLSSTTAYNDNTYDVKLHFGDNSYIEKDNIVDDEPTSSDLVNNQELKPFWIRYKNNLVEVGKGTESEPFLKYQFKEADGLLPSIDYMALLSQNYPSEWIIDSDPVCGIKNRTETPTQTQPQVKTVCKVKTGRP